MLEFRLPDLGEGVAETEIVRWLVHPGERVTEDQPMVEVMTDKATVEIPAPAAGRIESLHAADGDVVAVGSVIVAIETDEPVVGVGSARENTRAVLQAGADTGAPAAAAAASGAASHSGSAAGMAARGPRVQATPLVRRLATELGVELTTLHGSGPNGRITDEDVRAAAGNSAGAESSSASGAAASGGAQAADVKTRTPAGGLASVPAHAREGARVVPLRGMRRQIGEHLSRAAAIPTVTIVEDADLSAVERARAAAGLSPLPYLARAVVEGLREVPELNSLLDEAAGELLVLERIDLGIAVQTDAGLLVPVLRDCAERSLESLDAGIRELADAARAGTITADQLRGGSFTITSAGKLGGLFTTPLLNVPEVGILGLHRAEDRAVVRAGEITVRRMANLSVTFDHRALDGLSASRFLLRVIEGLERA